MIKDILKDIFYRTFIKDIYKGQSVKDTLSEEQYVGLMSQLWENPGFQKYASARNATLIYMMAGAPGSKPEPRDEYMRLKGRRDEMLELMSRAKVCFMRRNKIIEDKKLSTGNT